MSPQTKRRIADEVDPLAVGQCVPAVAQVARIVALLHRGQIGVLVADPFDLLAGQFAGAVGDAKPLLRRAVDQVGGGRQVCAQVVVSRPRTA